MVNEKMLPLIACPACDDRPPLRPVGETLVCERCGRVYPVNNGIPDLLVDSAAMPEQPRAEGAKPE